VKTVENGGEAWEGRVEMRKVIAKTTTEDGLKHYPELRYSCVE